MESLETILDRQLRINKWDQKALNEAQVTLLGSGPLCHYVSSALAGLNIGTIIIMDDLEFGIKDSNEFLFLNKNYARGTSKAYALRDILSAMNRHNRVLGFDSIFSEGLSKGSKVIVDLTNDGYSKARSLEHCVNAKVPFISASSDEFKGCVASYIPLTKLEEKLLGFKRLDFGEYLNEEFEGKKQGNVPSGVIAGLVVDDIRKVLFRFNQGDTTLKSKIWYNTLSKNRVGTNDDYTLSPVNFKDSKVIVIGAGALGNFVGINLALLGIGNITFVDYDSIEPSNLNRQICYTFYECLGKNKVDVLKDILKKMNPTVNVQGILGKIVSSDYKVTDKEKKNGIEAVDMDYLSNFDAVISCLDNPDTRLVLNSYVGNLARSKGRIIPLIDGGTGATGGNVSVYIPGINSCINCQIGYSSFPKVRNRCTADDHEPSVVYTNLIIGSMMGSEASMVLLKDRNAEPIKTPMYYKSFYDNKMNIDGGKFAKCEICK